MNNLIKCILLLIRCLDQLRNTRLDIQKYIQQNQELKQQSTLIQIIQQNQEIRNNMDILDRKLNILLGLEQENENEPPELADDM